MEGMLSLAVTGQRVGIAVDKKGWLGQSGASGTPEEQGAAMSS